MADENTILHDEAENVRAVQQVIRRQIMKRRTSLKALGIDSQIGYSTLRTYFPDPQGDQKPTAIPVSALRLLCGVLDHDLLSLLLPDGFQIVRVPENINHDEIAAWAESYAAKKLAAHRADSECQEQIGPNEEAELTAVVVAFPGSAAA